MKRVLLIAALAAMALFSYAQKLKGKVFDASNNNPLTGATISLAGKAATTDNGGVFSIDCNKLSELTVSFVGYETYRQKIRNCDEELKIGLISSDNTLNKVELTATSNQNKAIVYQPASIIK